MKIILVAVLTLLTGTANVQTPEENLVSQRDFTTRNFNAHCQLCKRCQGR